MHEKIVKASIIVISVILFFSSSTFSHAHTESEESAQFHLVFPYQEISAGQDFPLVVKIDSGKNAVNAVQANMSYPANKLQFLNIDYKISAFEITAENSGGGGLVKIARRAQKSVTGQQTVATVYFRSTSTTSANEISIANGSAIVASDDNTNIYSRYETIIEPLSNITNQPKVEVPKSTYFPDSVVTPPRDKKPILERIVNFNTSVWEWVLSALFPSIFKFIEQALNFR